jgi:hypothetical protein
MSFAGTSTVIAVGGGGNERIHAMCRGMEGSRSRWSRIRGRVHSRLLSLPGAAVGSSCPDCGDLIR